MRIPALLLALCLLAACSKGAEPKEPKAAPKRPSAATNATANEAKPDAIKDETWEGYVEMTTEAIRFLQERRFEDATAAYNSALALIPDGEAALIGKGVTLYEQGAELLESLDPEAKSSGMQLLDEAISLLSPAVEKHPKSPAAHFSLAVAHEL